ncbi:MAG: hypothetical protein IT531_19235 [Burkholderiales bacterium]|nr:hypothetical protein [Burkholderiales bacterium]
MRSIQTMALSLAALFLITASSAAMADRGRYYGHGHSHSRVHLGFVFGAPLWYPGPAYYPPYPYSYSYPAYPPAVIVPPAPRVYIERDEAMVAQENAPGYWYYCRDSQTYYPYVKQCATPWERVPAAPQGR